jgi:putative tricarboxylic transport membrane protein
MRCIDIGLLREFGMGEVTLIVHGPPGSAPPVMAAALTDAIAEAQADTRPWRLLPRGDDPGVDAMNLLATRPGDEDLLSTCTPVFLQAPLLRGMSLDHRQLTPITRLVADRYLVVVPSASRCSDPASFLEHIGRQQTRTGGYFRGGINHLIVLDIAARAGASVEFALVKSEPEVWAALHSGAIDWAVGTPVEVLQYLNAGSLRAVAALDEARLPRFPDVATLAEAGCPVTFQLWRGLMGAPALSRAGRDRFLEIVRRARSARPWRDYLAATGQGDDPLEGDQFAAFLDRQMDWYRAQFARAGLLPGADASGAHAG